MKDEETVLRADKIIVDAVEEAWACSGDLVVPHGKGLISKAAISGQLVDIMLNKHPGREKQSEITLYESVGFAPLDLAVAIEVYERSIRA